MQSIAIKAPKDDDLNLNEIYCAKLYEKYPLILNMLMFVF